MCAIEHVLFYNYLHLCTYSCSIVILGEPPVDVYIDMPWHLLVAHSLISSQYSFGYELHQGVTTSSIK